MSFKIDLEKGDIIVCSQFGDICQFDYEQLSFNGEDDEYGAADYLDSVPELPAGVSWWWNAIPRFFSGGITLVRINCNAQQGFRMNLAIRHDSDKVVLANIDIGDEHQQWVVDYTYGSIKGEKQRKFALINKATGQAIWRSRAEGEQYHVSLIKFDDPRYQDESALWKGGCVGKHGFHRIYAASNEVTYLNVDDANNVVIPKAQRRFRLKFGGGSGQIWKMVPVR